MPHIHISDGALFIMGAAALGSIGLICWYKLRNKALNRPVNDPPVSQPAYAAQGVPGSYSYSRGPNAQPYSPSPAYAAAPAPVYHDSSNGLLTGLILGEALSGGFSHRDTVVVEQPAYSAPVYDQGSSIYDSGSSGSSYDSGISYDSGSSSYDSGSSGGGIDISW